MLLLSALLLLAPQAIAWDNHQTILERMFETQSAKRRLYPYKAITIPCPEDEKREIPAVARELHIDGSKIPIFSAGKCKPGEKTTQVLLSDVLTSSMVDEPDMGMDQNLPDSEDPRHFRKWMGGSTGPTSQGFRHMYFAGFSIGSPFHTLQIPMGPVGDALERITRMREVSANYFLKGDKFWGTRILLWEIHYVQDLQQPFHVVQVPSLKMVPWKKLFSGFNQAATHTIGNFHYAYEGLILELMKEARTNDLLACLEQPSEGGRFENPEELIQEPRRLGNELGSNLVEFFGDAPMSESVDLPNGVGQMDYFALTHMPEPKVLPEDEMKELGKDEVKSILQLQTQFKAYADVKRITCELMNSVSRYTWNELDYAYLKIAESASNKKAK